MTQGCSFACLLKLLDQVLEKLLALCKTAFSYILLGAQQIYIDHMVIKQKTQTGIDALI